MEWRNILRHGIVEYSKTRMAEYPKTWVAEYFKTWNAGIVE